MDLVTFTKEIHNRKLHYLCRVSHPNMHTKFFYCIFCEADFDIKAFRLLLLTQRCIQSPIKHLNKVLSEIAKGFQVLTIFAKRSIIEVWLNTILWYFFHIFCNSHYHIWREFFISFFKKSIHSCQIV